MPVVLAKSLSVRLHALPLAVVRAGGLCVGASLGTVPPSDTVLAGAKHASSTHQDGLLDALFNAAPTILVPRSPRR